jgi:hypothetical protein
VPCDFRKEGVNGSVAILAQAQRSETAIRRLMIRKGPCRMEIRKIQFH